MRRRTYAMAEGESGIVCLICLCTSADPEDIERRYCPVCRRFHDGPLGTYIARDWLCPRCHIGGTTLVPKAAIFAYQLSMIAGQHRRHSPVCLAKAEELVVEIVC